MSILNRPTDGLLSVLLALRRALIAYGPLTEDRLLRLCAPPSVVPDGKADMARKTLTRWEQLGILCIESDRVRLAPELEPIGADDIDGVRRFLLHSVLNASNNPTFVDERDADDRDADDSDLQTKKDSKSKASDFTRASAWALAQDPYALDVSYKAIDGLQGKQKVKPALFSNSTRWDGFVEWAAFLGIGWSAAGRLVMDPTFAIQSVLDRVFSGGTDLSGEIFFARLAEELPIVDGGRYRTATETTVKEPWRTLQPGEVSPSLSLSMLHLDASGEIRLESRSDAPHRTLLGRKGRELRSLSHVVRLKRVT